MNKDEEMFKANIEGYSNYIKEFQAVHDQGRTSKVEHKFNFLTNDLKMLSYKEEVPVAVVVKKKENLQMDIMKLMKYTKRGQSGKWFSPSPSNYGLGGKPFSQMSKTASDFKSTRMTVKSEAEKAGTIDEVFAKKRETMDNQFKYSELPRTNDYEELIRVNSGKTTSLMFSDSSENLKEPISSVTSNKSKRNIISSFRRIYSDKASKWQVQEEEVEAKKMDDLKKNKATSIFLKQIKQLSRQPQYYCDSYSKKDGVTNQRINQFNRSLNIAFHSKKTIEKRVIRFNNKANCMHKVPNMKKKEKMELQEGDEAARKMKQNLKFDTKNEDIGLNYQVFAQRIEGRNNEQKLDPYKEFIEFKERVASKGAIVPLPSLNNQGGGMNAKSMKNLISNFKGLSSPLEVKSPVVSDTKEEPSEHPIQNPPLNNENKDMKYILVEKVIDSS